MKSVAEEEAAKEQPDETGQLLHRHRHRFSRYKRFIMLVRRLGKELLFALFITCTTYATLINM